MEEERARGKKRGAINKLQEQSKHSHGHGGGSRPDSAASQLRQGSLVNPSMASVGSVDSTAAARYRIFGRVGGGNYMYKTSITLHEEAC